MVYLGAIIDGLGLVGLQLAFEAHCNILIWELQLVIALMIQV